MQVLRLRELDQVYYMSHTRSSFSSDYQRSNLNSLITGLRSCVKVEVAVLGKLQALVSDILPWKKVPEKDARSVRPGIPSLISLRFLSVDVKQHLTNSLITAGHYNII